MPTMSEHPVELTSKAPSTILPAPPEAVERALREALAASPAERRDRLAAVAAGNPEHLAAWGWLAQVTEDHVESYAYARVGYHRGLDQLRRAGWRGAGDVRWTDEPNQGFLRSLEMLRRAAAAIGEDVEAARCDLFLRQLDPDWHGLPDE